MLQYTVQINQWLLRRLTVGCQKQIFHIQEENNFNNTTKIYRNDGGGLDNHSNNFWLPLRKYEELGRDEKCKDSNINMIFISSLKSIIWPYIVKIKYEELKVISRNQFCGHPIISLVFFVATIEISNETKSYGNNMDNKIIKEWDWHYNQ